MLEPDMARAIAAARTTAAAMALDAAEVLVLQNSNKLTLRLLPCDTLARVAAPGDPSAQFELELAVRLASTGSPVVALDPRVAPRVHERDGFRITFWTHYDSEAQAVAPAAYARALARLHAGMRRIEMALPRFTDRIAEAQRVLSHRHLSPDLADMDRDFLLSQLNRFAQTIRGHAAAEQMLHGEPHPGNLLGTRFGPLFIDLETCCTGPVEFDLAHVPDAVVEHYPGVDQALLNACRGLVLAMVAAWRWDANDQFPNGRLWREQFLQTLRNGEPWPSLDTMARRLSD